MTIILLTTKRGVVVLKNKLSALFALVCFALLVLCMGISDILPVCATTIYGKVLRLHVIADSDSKKDQDIKYKVRDEVLILTEELFCDCEDVHCALEIAENNKHLFENRAKKVLEENGCDMEVQVVIGRENYPEKNYAGITFPEGEYLSVRIVLGEGRGKNWWCVLFPPLCNAGVEDAGEVMSSYGINSREAEKFRKENKSGGINLFGCNIRLKFLDFLG